MPAPFKQSSLPPSAELQPVPVKSNHHIGKSSIVQRNLRMSLTSNQLKESSIGSATNQINSAQVANKMQNVSRTAGLFVVKDNKAVMSHQNAQGQPGPQPITKNQDQMVNQRDRQPILSSGSSQRSINFASCLSHRSKSNKQKLLQQQNCNQQPVAQKFIQQPKHHKAIQSPYRKILSNNAAMIAQNKAQNKAVNNMQGAATNPQLSQTYAQGFTRSTTIPTAPDANLSGKMIQFPHILKKDSQNQLLPAGHGNNASSAVTNKDSAGGHQYAGAQGGKAHNGRIRSEQRQGVTRTNTAVFTTSTMSSFQQYSNNQAQPHASASGGQHNSHSGKINQHVRKNLSSQPKVMTVGQVLLEQHQGTFATNRKHKQIRTPQLPTISRQTQQQSTVQGAVKVNNSGHFNTIRPQLMKQNTASSNVPAQNNCGLIMKRASGTTISAGGINNMSQQSTQVQTSILQTVHLQQQQSRLTSMNHHQQLSGQQMNSNSSTRPARIYTAKLTSGNLKQFFFNNNNNSSQMPSSKQAKHSKNYSPKAGGNGNLKHQRQNKNHLLISNDQSQLLQSASSYVQSTTVGAPPAASYQQEQPQQKQQYLYTAGNHRSYLLQLSSKKPHSGGHHHQPNSTHHHSMLNNNQHFGSQQANNGSILSSHHLIDHQTTQLQHNANNSLRQQNQLRMQSSADTNNAAEGAQGHDGDQIYQIHYSSSQTQLQQLSSAHQEFGGLFDHQYQQADGKIGHGKSSFQNGIANAQLVGKPSVTGRVFSGTKTSSANANHNNMIVFPTRNTMQVHQQNRKIVTNNTAHNINTTSTQYQQQQSQANTGNPRRTLYSAKQVSQVYRPSQVQLQNSSATKKKQPGGPQSGQQVLSNAATTLKMMQQTHQTQLFQNNPATANASTSAAANQQTYNQQRLIMQSQNAVVNNNKTNKISNTGTTSSASKTGGIILNGSVTPSQSLNASGKANGVMRHSQVLVSSNVNEQEAAFMAGSGSAAGNEGVSRSRLTDFGHQKW